MIWIMIYALLIAFLLGLAATCGERVLADLRWPRRVVWAVALAASLALPGWSVFVAAESAESAIVSLPFELDFELTAESAVPAADAAARARSWLSWPEGAIPDSLALGFWALSSSLMLLLILVAAVRLRLAVNRADSMQIGGRTVWLSDRYGPAILGFFRPRIVLPRWLARDESSLRSLVLRHETEHLAARDQLLLLGAVLVIAAMPWNPALWWQFRRLRAAIEVDCDARVLRDGTDALNYSKALFSVRERSAGTPLGAVALTEPVSELERRIRIMMDKARRFSVSAAGIRLGVAFALVGLAFAVNAPRAQQAGEQAAAGNSRAVIPAIRTHVYDQLVQAQQCLDSGDTACAAAMLDAVRALPDLNGYERAMQWNFRAYLANELDDPATTVESFEHVVENLNVIPGGLAADALYNLAELYQRQGRYEEAFDALSRYLALKGDRAPSAGLRFAFSDGASGDEYLPIVKVAPVYPPRAAARGLEGYVVVEYTVTATGATADVRVVESSSTLFENAATESARKYKYKPRIIDGVPVEVAGVRTKIVFALEPGAGDEGGADASAAEG